MHPECDRNARQMFAPKKSIPAENRRVALLNDSPPNTSTPDSSFGLQWHANRAFALDAASYADWKNNRYDVSMEHRAALWGKRHIRDISIAFKGLSSRSLWNSRWAGLGTFDEPCDMCTMHRNSFSSDSCDSIKVSRTPVIFAHSIHSVTGCTRNQHNTNQSEVILTFEFDACDGSSPIKKPGHLSIDVGILGGHTRTQTIENITQKMDAIQIDLQARLIHRFHGIRLKCDQNKQHLSGFCFCLRAHDSHSPGHSGDFLLMRDISNARERYKMHREPRRLRAKAL